MEHSTSTARSRPIRLLFPGLSLLRRRDHSMEETKNFPLLISKETTLWFEYK